MAYNGVKKPRFYIDEIQYLQSIGFDFKKHYEDNYFQDENQTRTTYLDNPNLFGLSPENQKEIVLNDVGVYIDSPSIINNIEGDNIGRYIALLNHKDIDSYTTSWVNSNDGTEKDRNYGDIEILNYESHSSIDGCSILGYESNVQNFNFNSNESTFSRINLFSKPSNNSFFIGSISQGIYYDLRSPDLDVELTTEFDGFSTTKTLGGSTITNVRYAGSPWWYDVDANKIEPWSVGESSNLTKRNGRRVWSLKFSYLSDTDIFASNNMSNNYYEHSTSQTTDNIYNDVGDLSDDANDFRYTLEEDNSFMAQVINRIGNGQRFIFQPDKTNNNPDQFAICMLDMDEFSVKQVAHRTYSFDLKIREVW